MNKRSRRSTAYASLACYWLATMVAVLHDHSHTAHHGHVTAAFLATVSDERPGVADHHLCDEEHDSDHRHDHTPCQTPESDDSCFVCQFLASQPLVAQRASLVACGDSLGDVHSLAPRRVIASPFTVYDGRAPPCAA